MKFTIPQKLFADTLSIVKTAVSSKNTIPVLSGIYMRAEGTKLVLRATDMEKTIEMAVLAGVEVPGDLVLPAAMLTDLVKRIPFGDVTVEADRKNNTAAVKYGKKSQSVIHGFDAGQFPSIPDFEGSTSFAMPQGALREFIERTTFAAGSDESKPWLMGVLTKLEGNKLSGTSTDGVRIAYKESAVENSDNQFKVIVPGVSLNTLGKFLSSKEEDRVTVSLAGNGNLIKFDLGKMIFISRLLEGQYPDVMRLVPKDFPTLITIQRSEVLDAIERAALLAKDGGIKLSLKDDSLTITSQRPEVGAVTEEVGGALKGDALDIGFNSKFLIEYLKTVDAEKVELQCTGARNPARLVPVGDNTFLYVVLPLITF